MRLHSLWNICAEAQIMLCAVVAAGEVNQINRADNVTVTAKVEKSQNGTFSVSTM